MPIVHIDILKRPTAKKRALVEAMTRAVSETLDVAPEGVWVIVNEMETDQLAIAGKLVADRRKKAAPTGRAPKTLLPNKQTRKKRIMK